MIKEDCVNYHKIGTKRHRCRALKELECKNKDACSFYKSNKEYKLKFDKGMNQMIPEKRWGIS